MPSFPVCNKWNRVKSDLLICQKSYFLQVLEAELGIMFTSHTTLGICVLRAVAGDDDCEALGVPSVDVEGHTAGMCHLCPVTASVTR